MNRLVLIAGDAHPDLAREIAALAGLPIAPASISTFADGETRAVIEADVRRYLMDRRLDALANALRGKEPSSLTAQACR